MAFDVYHANATFQMIKLCSSSEQQDYLADPDVRLMLRLSDGDLTAFDQLVDRYYPTVQASIRHSMSNDRWVDDLTQEVFMRMFRGRVGYSPKSKFTTWLFTIVSNVVSNAKQRKSCRRWLGLADVQQQWLTDGDIESDASTPYEQTVKQETCEIVRHSVNSLSRRQRIAVRMYYFQGMRHKAIARELDTSPESVKSLLQRARRRLETILGAYSTEGHLPHR